jgi:hypothetical protein
MRIRELTAAALLVGVCGQAGVGQQGQNTPVDAQALVKRAVEKHLYEYAHHRPVAYRFRKVDEGRDTTKEIVETKDGDVARIIAVNGQAPSGAVNQAELNRLQILAGRPDLQEKRHVGEQKDAARVNSVMGMLPDAFLYRVEAVVACGSGKCYQMSFTPNPKWTPPNMEADLLRGVAGKVWIDVAQERLTKLDAHFVADANFGWGILARVDKGGEIVLEQADIGGGEWELTGMKMNLVGKALMVKTIRIQIQEEMSGFTPMREGMGYRQAIEMLEKWPAGFEAK